MSRRRNTGSQPESFQLRWHSVANPGTASVDIMSSPDPLNDPATPDQVPSSNTRRVTRSQRAHKFLSLGTSPRKQAYELDVGSSRSSRGLVVSVETDEDDARDGDTRRTLFPTPSPGPASATRTRERTTTTVVPLKYSIEDESSDVLGSTNATPRPRKTRIRTSNGTPIPKPTTRKRKAPTPPARRTPGAGTVADSMDSDSMSDAPAQRSPTPKRRARTPRKRIVEPSSDLGAEPMPVANSIRRSVRRRRRAMAPDELVELADVANNAAVTSEIPPSEDDLQRDMSTVEPTEADRGIPTLASEADPESDIWMTTMSQDATPRASAQQAVRTSAQVEEQEEEREPSVAMSEGDYGYLAPAASDVSSVDDEPPVESLTTRRNDTIAQGEDFSMILMDSIPSLQASTHGAAQASTYSEIGDDTNLIINNTLESLRQGEVADQEDEGDDENDDADTLDGEESGNELDEPEITTSEQRIAYSESRPESQSQGVSFPSQSESEDPASGSESDEGSVPEELEEEPHQQLQDLEQQQEAEPERDAERLDEDLGATLREMQAKGLELEHEATPIGQPSSVRQSSARSRNLQLSQSPRKAINSSPLRHRVLKQSVGQAEGSPSSSSRGADTPNRSPRPMTGNEQTQVSRDDSMMYEDSFSEIPDAVLQAATPRRPGMATEFEELDDAEMDQVMGEFEASQVHEAAAADVEQLAEDAETAEEPEEAEFGQEEEVEPQEPSDEGELDYAVANIEEENGEVFEEDAHGNDFEEEAEADGDEMMEGIEENGREEDSDEVAEEQEIDDINEERENEEHELEEEHPLPSNVSDAQSEASRLPTPDKSPRGVPQVVVEAAPVSARRQPRTHSFFNSPIQTSHLPQPSPTPRSRPATAAQQAETAAQRSGSSLEETPRNQISSPIQQPQSLVQDSASIQHLRPALSSIVRVGRVLQSVTSDPPSPEAGDRHLGSPFRSSGSREPRSGSREREGSRLASRSPSARILSKSPTARMLSFGKPGQPSLSPQRHSPQRRSPFRERTRSIEPAAATLDVPYPNLPEPSVSPPRQSLFRQSTRNAEPPVTFNPPQPESPELSVSPPQQPVFRQSKKIDEPPVTFNSAQPELSQPSSSRPLQSIFRRSTRSFEPTTAASNPQRPTVSPQRQSIFRESIGNRGFTSREEEPSVLEEDAEEYSLLADRRAAEEAQKPKSPTVASPSQNDSQWARRSMAGRVSANSSLQHSPPSDGEMSWVANEGPISPNLRGDNTLKDVAATSTRPAGRSSFFSRSPVRPAFMPRAREPEPVPEPEPEPEQESEAEPEAEPELDLDHREQEQEPATRDDETDIWEFEAQRETPKPPRQQPFGTSSRKMSQTPRRAGTPSPWMRKSIQASSRAPRASAVPVQLAMEEPGSPSRQEEPSHQEEHSRLEEDGDEYSLLARRRAAEEAQKLSESAAKASKFDLSSFFSSPAAIPGMLADKFFPGRSKPAESTSAPAPARPAAPVMTSGNMFPQVPQMEFVPSSAGRRSLFSSASPEQQQQQKSPAKQQPGSPETPEQLSLPRASSANLNFTPRARQTSHTFAQPSSTAPTAATAATPPRMQLSHADIRKWQQDAQVSSTSSNASDDSFVRPLLRPLPPKHASPTKSSLRSPLKPRTPGRVVEFTSSVLSPLEQAHARHQRQISQSMLSQSMSFFDEDDNNNNEVPGGYEEAEQENSDDKENQDSSDVSMADAPPLGHSGQGTDLSQTAWTRQHWLLLDELIQARRQGPFEERYERRSDKFLGKTVKSQGEAMRLERWHLDCVDAFKAEVGGWDEGALAKRLFALLLGEVRRSGETPQRRQRTVMFH